MLLSNNNETAVNNSAVRRPKIQSSRRKDKGLAGSSSARNSWSFAPIQPNESDGKANGQKEIHYLDPEGMFTNIHSDMKSVSRSRLRQRSISNLTAGVRDKSRDQSLSNRQGNATKGIDYIRINQTVRKMPNYEAECDIHDRSQYGNPDGQSAHSTAERETTGKSDTVKPSDMCQVINQNKSNDLKINHNHCHANRKTPILSNSPRDARRSTCLIQDTEPTLTRLGSGRGSARLPLSNATEIHNRKSAATNPVKMEWTFLPPTENHETNAKPEESSLVRKGLLWVMRDRLFSRWHERFCSLTHNYLHCFKKGSETNVTQMGNFLFKVNLTEVTDVQWLDKRGTAIVCLTLAKEGRLLLKTSHDLNGWFDCIKNCIQESKGRRQTLLERKNGLETAHIVTPLSQRRLQNDRLNQPVLRERSATSRSRQLNRYSLITDLEIKTTPTTGMESTNNELTEPASLCFVPGQQILCNSKQPTVQVPFRERSSSFDRSRPTKAEREFKRRSYFHNHVTQV